MSAVCTARMPLPRGAAPMRRWTGTVILLIGAAPRGSGIRAVQTALMRTRLPRLVVDSIAGAGLHLHEERPDVVISAIRGLARMLPSPSAPH